MDLVTIVLAVSAGVGLYLAWNVGASDVANALGTAVGSGSLSHGRAIVLGAVFATAGAVFASQSVSRTLTEELLRPGIFRSPEALGLGMMAALLATLAWVQIGRRLEITISTSHSIVGALVGLGLATGGAEALRWDTLGRIGLAWALAPFLAGFLAHETFFVLNRHVIGTRHPVIRLRRLGPILIFFSVALVAVTTLRGALIQLAPIPALGIGAGVALVGALIARSVLMRPGLLLGPSRIRRVERAFLGLQAATACALAFAHGSNDLASVLAPIETVVRTIGVGSRPGSMDVVVVASIALVLGLWTLGYQVLEVVSRDVELTPSRGLAAEFGASTVILGATAIGLPMSAIHVMVGAVVGVSFARSVGALNLQVLRSIASSLLVTLPATVLLSALFVGVAKTLLE